MLRTIGDVLSGRTGAGVRSPVEVLLYPRDHKLLELLARSRRWSLHEAVSEGLGGLADRVLPRELVVAIKTAERRGEDWSVCACDRPEVDDDGGAPMCYGCGGFVVRLVERVEPTSRALARRRSEATAAVRR